jgi:hypothetical protein
MTSPSTTTVLDVEPTPDGVPLLQVPMATNRRSWLTENRDRLLTSVAQEGALMVRGLELRAVPEVEAVMRLLQVEPMVERESFAPRTVHAPGIYAATDWPPNQQMCMHHEMSYALRFPGLMLFACLEPPSTGGATPVADARAVLEALPAELVTRFEQGGWMLIRTYNDEIGASWEDAFGTDDRSAVEEYCRAHAIDLAWQPDGGLRTRQTRSAVIRHHRTGERCWFNQVAFLSQWTLEAEIREYLVDVYGPDGLPFDTRFGNGDPVGEEVVATINATYEAHTRQEPWRAGDLLLVDNVSAAHSREPFAGPREVVVGMGDPVDLAQGGPTGATRSPR